MRLADFAADTASARAAAALSQHLFLYRANSVRARDEQILGINIEDSTEFAPPDARRPLEGLDAVFGAGVVRQRGGTTAPVLLVDQILAGHPAEPGAVMQLPRHSELADVVGPLWRVSRD